MDVKKCDNCEKVERHMAYKIAHYNGIRISPNENLYRIDILRDFGDFCSLKCIIEYFTRLEESKQ